MNTNYISIKSVLYDLSLTIDDRYWNETKMTEWLAHGYRQLGIEDALVDKVHATELVNHKATLPSDFKYLTQVAYKLTDPECCDNVKNAQDLPENSELNLFTNLHSKDWQAMRLNSSPFANAVCYNKQMMNCTSCVHEFTISPSLIITATLKHAPILIAYKAYAVDEEGNMLIPDDETLKEGLLHYALYRYWMMKAQMKEQGSGDMMQFHLKMWNHFALKSTKLNLPDINQLENLKAQHNKLFPKDHRFQELFSTLSNMTNVNY